MNDRDFHGMCERRDSEMLYRHLNKDPIEYTEKGLELLKRLDWLRRRAHNLEMSRYSVLDEIGKVEQKLKEEIR